MWVAWNWSQNRTYAPWWLATVYIINLMLFIIECRTLDKLRSLNTLEHSLNHFCLSLWQYCKMFHHTLLKPVISMVIFKNENKFNSIQYNFWGHIEKGLPEKLTIWPFSMLHTKDEDELKWQQTKQQQVQCLNRHMRKNAIPQNFKMTI